MGADEEMKSVQNDDPTEGGKPLAQDTTTNNNTTADVQNIVDDTEKQHTDGNTGGEDTTAEKRKRRREAWEKAKEAGRRFDLHRGLGNILRRSEDLFVETEGLKKRLHVPLPKEEDIPEEEVAHLVRAHEKRLMDMLGTVCKKILNGIMANKWSWPFNAPVDVNVYKDYLEKVTTPMDFGTIKKNLDTGRYRHPEQFVEHVRLVFNNARMYNKPGSDVHVMAKTLQEKFEDRYAASIVPRIVEETKRKDAEKLECRRRMAERAALGGREQADGECAALIQAIDSLISDIDIEKMKAAASCAPVDRKTKEDICQKIQKLPEEEFGHVLGIVMHHYPGVKSSTDIAFDIETLDALCLRQILDYLRHYEEEEPRGNWPPPALLSSSSLPTRSAI